MDKNRYRERMRKKQQQLRRQSSSLMQKQQELDTIVGSMEEGMVLLDADGNVLTMNRAAKLPFPFSFT